MRLATRWGPGIGGDATIYIESARNFLAGHGLGLLGPRGEFRLLPYFPPFYSLVIAALGWMGVDLVAAAHWVNMLSFAGLIFLTGAVTLRISRSWLLALAIELLLAMSPVLIPTYSWAMSEPLSFLLGFAALVSMLSYLGVGVSANGSSVPRRGKVLLLLSALLAGCSFLTRYSSVAFVAVGVLGVLLLDVGRVGIRLLKVLRYALVALFPMTVWVVYDLTHTAALASRSLESSTGMASRFVNFWQLLQEVILFWLIPDSWIYAPRYPSSLNTFLVPLFVLALLGGVLLVAWKLRRAGSLRFQDQSQQFGLLLLLFILLYLLVLLVVYVMTYPPITIGSRMLSPAHIAVLWLVVVLMSLSLHVWRARGVRVVLLAGLALAIVWYGWRSARIVAQYYQTGLGYTSTAWRASGTIEAVKDLPQDILLVSNETNAILFLTGRPAYPLMEIYRDHPLEVFSAYGSGDLTADEPQRLFREGKAVLVLFDTIDDQLVGLYGDRTAERIAALVKGLYRATRAEDGGIFYYHKP